MIKVNEGNPFRFHSLTVLLRKHTPTAALQIIVVKDIVQVQVVGNTTASFNVIVTLNEKVNQNKP